MHNICICNVIIFTTFHSLFFFFFLIGHISLVLLVFVVFWLLFYDRISVVDVDVYQCCQLYEYKFC